jgi:SAM-dependent methyltransferase
MSKQSKLTEKATRMPDIRPTHWDETINKYLADVEPMNSESARSQRFGMLVNQLIGFEPGFIESYVSGIEKYLKAKQKDRILKGKADNLFGNIIIEFEANIPKKLSEAEEQLCRYVAILWSQEHPSSRKPYLCIATDGVRFYTYSPRIAKTTAKDVAPEDVRLHLLEKADWTNKPHEVYFWLDRYFLRKEILHPTSEAIVSDFGVRSHAFQTTTYALLSLWQNIKSKSSFEVIYESWEKYLRIVYGSAVAGDELFISHTYLATLAKLMSWTRITDSKSLPDDSQIVEMLEGRLFKAQGIENFIEEDFFSWLARDEAVKVGVSVSRWLFSLLQNYNLHELSEDVLKSLYQELIDPETRHDLGEFYTPDWLAHRMVNKLLDINPNGSMLDPACGSGTFLYLAVKEKRDRLGDSQKTLNHILESVYGVDIHPLAVIVAKTNYILALGDLLKARKVTISIPVYLADSLKLPERWAKTKEADYEVTIHDRSVYLPEALLVDLELHDQAIELAKEYARQNKKKPIALQPFSNYLKAQNFGSTDASLVQALFAISEALKHFIDDDRDTIWAFVLKNIYKPLFLKGKFDFVMGNPPWIIFNRINEPVYQAFLKRQIVDDYGLIKGRAENISNLEIATLFLVRGADLYLKKNGTIAFVLPRSLFSADQHDGLRKRTFKFSENTIQALYWRELWDCENVSPLFNVPSCVVVANKKELPRPSIKRSTQKAEVKAIPGQILSGKLKRKNASLVEAKELPLIVNDVKFSLHMRGARSYWASGKGATVQAASPYKKLFARGASILPRSFWFVQVKPSPLGFNPELPPLETSDRAKEEAKDAYKSVFFKDTVESRFIYATLLSTDLLPFGHLDYRLVVLPIEPAGDHYKLIDYTEAHKRGFLNLARWLVKAETEWSKRRSNKASRITALGWLDYRRKLTVQNPQAMYRTIYNKGGTFPSAAVVENRPIKLESNGQLFTARGLLADEMTYYYDTTSFYEASYLSSILNAPITNEKIKPMQSRGLWGPRDIHKKILELPIPQFDEKNKVHVKLAKLGEECGTKVEKWLASGGMGNVKSIGRLRSMVRQMLSKELAEIDELVKKILG